MKKHFLKFILLSSLAMPLLAGCEGALSLPTTAKEKISFAFNGVEKSMKAQSSAKKSAFEPKRAYASEEDVDSLFSYMEEEGQTENPEFRYDEPPMIQFQYIKALYEAVGDDFALGTIYSDTITGKIDYDFATDAKGLEQSYTMNLRLSIAIDDQDLITALCGMDILYKDAQENEHHQQFYAELELNYDMQKTSPNYSLGCFVVDNCTAFPGEEPIISYENDFVDTKDNKIREWRKATLEANQLLAMDANHPNFASYLQEEGFKFQVGARGYRNNTLYHATRTGYSNPDHQATRRALSSLLCDRIGCNSKDILHREYFDRQTAKNSKITDVYNQFSRILGMDLCQSMPITGAGFWKDKGAGDSHGNDAHQIVNFAFFGEGSMQPYSLQDPTDILVVTRDCTIRDLITDDGSLFESAPKGAPRLYYIDENQQPIREADLGLITDIVLGTQDESATPEVSLGTLLSSIEGDLLKKDSSYYAALAFLQGSPDSGNGYFATIMFDVSAVFAGHSQTTPKEVTSIAAVGSFNGWSLEKGLWEFSRIDGTTYTLEAEAHEGDEFKFIVNHSWDLPSYGFDDVTIQGDVGLLMKSKTDDNGNIYVLGDCTLSISASVHSPEDVEFSVSVIASSSGETSSETSSEPELPRVSSIEIITKATGWDAGTPAYRFDPTDGQNFQCHVVFEQGTEFKITINQNHKNPYGFVRLSPMLGAVGVDWYAEGQNDAIVVTGHYEFQIEAIADDADNVIFRFSMVPSNI
ncbi:MAG: hypothetical protein J5736_02660 [Bacilli bacterium]|nr:hypothetical protein [Bacilli bacterium]